MDKTIPSRAFVIALIDYAGEYEEEMAALHEPVHLSNFVHWVFKKLGEKTE